MCRDSIGYNLTPCDICALCLFVLIFFLLLPSSADQKNKEIDIRKIVSTILLCLSSYSFSVVSFHSQMGDWGGPGHTAMQRFEWLSEKKQKIRMTKKPIYGCHLSRSNPNKPIFLFSFFSDDGRRRLLDHGIYDLSDDFRALLMYTLGDGPRGWALRVWIVL
jgi:hypothetical protein